MTLFIAIVVTFMLFFPLVITDKVGKTLRQH